MTKSKCMYCNHPAVPGFSVEEPGCEAYVCCSMKCKRKAEAFLRFAGRARSWFLGLVFLSAVTMIVGSFTAPHPLIPIGLALVGVLLVVFPFCTPQTIDWIGIRKSIWVVRLFGVAIIGGCALIWVLF